jgi:hypothetical protein
MKIKHFLSLLIMFLMLALGSSLYAGLTGNYYESDQFKYSVNGEPDWTISDKERRYQVKMVNPKTGSFVGVNAIPKEGKIGNARDLAMDYIEAWDSWIYTAGRYLSDGESPNGVKGFQVMYGKNMLDPAKGRYKQIIIERYFVHNGLSYIVTAWTNDLVWLDDKQAISNIFSSFKIN